MHVPVHRHRRLDVLIEAIATTPGTTLRRWHDRTLRASFDERGGEEIDHAGDGFFVAFPDPASAVVCAMDIQRRLAEHRRTHGFAPHVRMGVHATTATRDGTGYVGLGVHAASRIAALAGAGEILASVETLEDIEVTSSDLRSVALKGIADRRDRLAPLAARRRHTLLDVAAAIDRRSPRR
jgi:class 3 adenylate cyclase